MSDESTPSKKAKTWYQQKFKQEWLKDPLLKSWLQPDDSNEYSAICTVCDCKLKNPNKNALVAHQNAAKHLKKLYSGKVMYFPSDEEEDRKPKVKVVKHTLSPPEKKIKPSSETRKGLAKAELMLCAFVAEHSMPTTQTERLVDVIKKMCPDSPIAQSLTMENIRASCSFEDEMNDEHVNGTQNSEENYLTVVPNTSRAADMEMVMELDLES